MSNPFLVLKLQNDLIKLGILKSRADGYWGRDCIAAWEEVMEKMTNLDKEKSVNPISADFLLVRGDRGDHVMMLQKELQRIGYVLTADGDFGPTTELAVRKYQKSVDIVTDGRLGNKTMASITATKFPETLTQSNLERVAVKLAIVLLPTRPSVTISTDF